MLRLLCKQIINNQKGEKFSNAIVYQLHAYSTRGRTVCTKMRVIMNKLPFRSVLSSGTLQWEQLNSSTSTTIKQNVRKKLGHHLLQGEYQSSLKIALLFLMTCMDQMQKKCQISFCFLPNCQISFFQNAQISLLPNVAGVLARPTTDIASCVQLTLY